MNKQLYGFFCTKLTIFAYSNDHIMRYITIVDVIHKGVQTHIAKKVLFNTQTHMYTMLCELCLCKDFEIFLKLVHTLFVEALHIDHTVNV